MESNTQHARRERDRRLLVSLLFSRAKAERERERCAEMSEGKRLAAVTGAEAATPTPRVKRLALLPLFLGAPAAAAAAAATVCVTREAHFHCPDAAGKRLREKGSEGEGEERTGERRQARDRHSMTASMCGSYNHFQ